MANITGTQDNDILTGTAGDDTIQGLGGNDRIIATNGSDTVDGGAGNDTIDFSGVDRDMLLSSSGNYITAYVASPGSGAPPNVYASLTSIETIVGNPNRSNTIFDSSRYIPLGKMDVDLYANKLTFYPKVSNDPKTFIVKNFDNINALQGDNYLIGNARNNIIRGGSNSDTIVGSKGQDTLDGGSGKDILDYSNLRHAVKFSLSEQIISYTYPGGSFTSASNEGTVDKGSFGKDKVANFEKIIGANNRKNILDASTANDRVSIDLNLATNSLKVNIPNIDPQQFEIVNFANVIGTKNNDTIVGANLDGKLTGGGGNDTICGGTKHDRITGTDSTARGVGEHDILTGGGGRDKFILGDKNGAYYVGKGNDDYATITDFDLFKDSISIGNCKNYSFALEGTNTIDLFSGKDVNHRDLIAKIQITSGISSASSNSKSTMGADVSLNAIISKMDIFSGSEKED
jgi:Ca2+-binding RTX toxin-like protein